jgi:NitT/TauT family transport system permease protein
MLPFLFAGLEIAIIFSVIGAIVAEFIGASVGLGSVIIQRQAAVDVAGVFSVLVYLSVMRMAST